MGSASSNGKVARRERALEMGKKKIGKGPERGVGKGGRSERADKN